MIGIIRVFPPKGMVTNFRLPLSQKLRRAILYILPVHIFEATLGFEIDQYIMGAPSHPYSCVSLVGVIPGKPNVHGHADRLLVLHRCLGRRVGSWKYDHGITLEDVAQLSSGAVDQLPPNFSSLMHRNFSPVHIAVMLVHYLALVIWRSVLFVLTIRKIVPRSRIPGSGAANIYVFVVQFRSIGC